MNALITCSHVDFGYENYDAVVDVSMEVEQGDYLCIVGENGAGKSTLMKGLLGLLKPTAGVIEIGDELKKTGIGYLPQQTAAQKDFPATVWEVVLSGTLSRMGLRPFYKKEEKERAVQNMERLNISHLKNQCFRDLSGGQQQRVLIARALCATEDVYKRQPIYCRYCRRLKRSGGSYASGSFNLCFLYKGKGETGFKPVKGKEY